MEGGDDFDWYGLLGCDINSSKEDIGKATRKLSLKYHPDKNPDPKAAETFLLLQKAKNFLLDDEKRKTYDDKLKKVLQRKKYELERNSNMDERRKRMRDELESRIKQTKSNVESCKADEIRAKQKRSANIETLRKESNVRMEASAAEEERKLREKAKELEKHLRHMANEFPSSGSHLNYPVKVKWKRDIESHSDDSLYKLFSKYGPIEDVVLTGEKGNAAIITFSNQADSVKAVDEFAASEVMRVSHLNKAMNPRKTPSVYSHNYGAANHMYESSDLYRLMKTAEEKEDLVRRMMSAKNIFSIPDTSNASNLPYHGNSRTLNSDSGNVGQNECRGTLESKEKEVIARMLAAAKARKLAGDSPASGAQTTPNLVS